MLRILLLISRLGTLLQAQELQVVFMPTLEDEALVFSGAGAGAVEGDQRSGLTVETLRFYISEVVLASLTMAVERIRR